MSYPVRVMQSRREVFYPAQLMQIRGKESLLISLGVVFFGVGLFFIGHGPIPQSQNWGLYLCFLR